MEGISSNMRHVVITADVPSGDTFPIKASEAMGAPRDPKFSIPASKEEMEALRNNRSWKTMNWESVPWDIDWWNKTFNRDDFYVIEIKIESTDPSGAKSFDLRIAKYDDQDGVFYYKNGGIVSISPSTVSRYIKIRGLE